MQKRKNNEVILQQYTQQGNKCVYCKESTPFEDITRDHFDPKSKRNTFINNKVFSCYRCNHEKANKDIYEFNTISFTNLCNILKVVSEDQEWKMTEEQLQDFRYFTRRFLTTKEIIDNGGKPQIIFT